MRTYKYPLILGFSVGSLFSFAAAASLVIMIRDGGISPDAIANFIGAGLGAAITVGGTRLLESWNRQESASAQAQVLLADLFKVKTVVHQCAAAGKALEAGVTFGVEFEEVAASALGAADLIDRSAKACANVMPDIFWQGMIVRDALTYFAADVDRRRQKAGQLSALFIPVLVSDLEIAKKTIETMINVCERRG